jgi:hypothetical protein
MGLSSLLDFIAVEPTLKSVVGPQILIFFHSFIHSFKAPNSMMPLIFPSQDPTTPQQPKTYIYSPPPPRPHFVLFQQKLELQIIWSTKLLGWNYIWNCNFFWVFKIIVMEFSAIQGHDDETAPLKLFVLCFIELFGW